VLAEEKMNDEDKENEALKGPVILTIPASVAVPGFGFLVALNFQSPITLGSVFR